MKVRAQIAMVLNLDKCIGCHTCSVTCKNVWTSREGMEYAWFNNVETKPGIGYPKEWENQERWNGGWRRKRNGKIEPRIGAKWRVLANIFANPDLPEIDDYYEPFTFDYQHLQKAPELQAMPTARPRSLVSGERMEKIEWGPNWEEILGGEFAKRSADVNFEGVQKEIYGQFENTFMMYLPRLCEHCLNPACVAACPSGAIYKREEDGIVLIDQDKCRGWRMCVSGCPYKKIYYNWSSGKSEKCIFCFPRIEAGQPTVCSETCVGRIRYLGVVLYDADRIEEAASVADEQDLYEAQLSIFLDPNDPAVLDQARADGVPENWLEAAIRSPVWKMAMEWKVAFPLHPEYRTLPMVWYVPPLSPINAAAETGKIGFDGEMPDVRSLRIPLQYLANLLTAGEEEPVALGLERMLAMRAYMRAKTVDGVIDESIAHRVGLDGQMIDDMYQIMAIANYEDRFVIPTAHRELDEDAYDMRGSCGFSFGNGCSGGTTETNLFGTPKKHVKTPMEVALMGKIFKALSALLSYPDEALQKAAPELRAVIDEDGLLPPENRRYLDALIEEIATGDLFALQERYVELFDRTRSLSLHLFEHVYGESRDRGQAMIDLKTLYEQNGLYLSTSELPDYLPAFLEFLSIRPLDEAREQLSQPAHILTALAERLHKRHSPYAAVFDGLTALAVLVPDAEVEACGGRRRCRSQRLRRARCAMGRGGRDVRPGRSA